MRPQQQNRRIPPRRNNNAGAMRRGPNPLTRNYESSGPEVKIRGNAQHIADKYLALARDAQALGDRILAESYLQHAEHYTRIILAAQGGERDARPMRESDASSLDAEDSAPAYISGNNADDSDESAPQPVINGVPGEVALMGHSGGYKDNSAEDDDAGRYDRRQPRRRLPARRSSMPRRPFRSEMGEGEQQPGSDNVVPINAADDDSFPVRRRRAEAQNERDTGGSAVRRSRFTPADNGDSDQYACRANSEDTDAGIRDSAARTAEVRVDDISVSSSQREDKSGSESAGKNTAIACAPENKILAAGANETNDASASARRRADHVAYSDEDEGAEAEARPMRRSRRVPAAKDADGEEQPARRAVRGRPRRAKISAAIQPAETEQAEQADTI